MVDFYRGQDERWYKRRGIILGANRREGVVWKKHSFVPGLAWFKLPV